MRLRRLQVFLKVVDEGNFGRAALELDVSQSTVSHAVRALERDLGVRLLERGRFGARPTPVGARIADHARVLLGLEAALLQEASLAAGAVRGELRLAVFESFARVVLPGLLARLRSEHEELRVRIVEVEETREGYTEALGTGRVDVAFGAWEIPPACIGWELMRDEHVVVLRADAPTTAERLSYDDLVDLPLVLAEGSECTVRLLANLEERGQHVATVLRAKGNDTILRLVAEGLGVAVLPELAVTLGPGIRTVPFDRLVRPIQVVLPPHNLTLPAVRALLAAVRERFPASEVPAFARP